MTLPRQWNGDVALASLNPPAVFPELYYPLWWYSGGWSYNTNASSQTNLITKGTYSSSNIANKTNANTLFTLNANWNAQTLYALESTLMATSGYTASASLWDLTSGSTVSGSTISTSSTTATVVRSGKFTLTPGHSYAVSVGSSTQNEQWNITDASLIIFPPSPTTSPYDVASVSLANPSGNTLKESYIPLWVYSSGSVNFAGGVYAAKGSTGTSTTINSFNTLFTLSNSWSPAQNFALEVSVMQGTSSNYVYLADMSNLGSEITQSKITTSSTTFNLMRSGSFTLTPGHSYGLYGYNIDLSKAHLVALAN